jgi:uncharacterized protein YukE
MQTTPEFHTTNPHSDHFNEFGNARLFERLEKKFKPKPYHYQYRIIRAVVLGSSFLFHILSAATAAALIWIFISKLISSEVLAGAITLVSLAALELSKRETSGRFFHDYLQFGKFSGALAFAVIGLAVISTTCSYFGADKAVKQFTAAPTLISADSTTAPLRASLAGIDQQISAARGTTWNGKTTERSQRTIDKLTRQKETILSELIRVQQRIDGKNDTTETDHTSTTNATAAGFAVFTVVCELLLILCLFYLEYYDYRSISEYSKLPAGSTLPGATDPAPTGILNGSQRPIQIVMNASVARAPATKVVGAETIFVSGEKRTCEYCKMPFVSNHKKQRFCCDQHRIEAWQIANGREVKRARNSAT